MIVAVCVLNDLRHFIREGRWRSEGLRVERVVTGSAIVDTGEASIHERRFHAGGVMIEVQRQRAVLELPGGRGDLLVAVEEGSGQRCAAAADLEAKWNLETIDDNGGILSSMSNGKG